MSPSFLVISLIQLYVVVPAPLPAPLWTYHGALGPSVWPTLPNDQACGGDKQSPINLEEPAHLSPAPDTIDTFDGYSATDQDAFTLHNDGHSAHIAVGADNPSRLHLGNDIYKLVQFHFHWGSNPSKGSEHTLNHKQYSSELHFVHMLDKYSSLGEALTDNKPNGLAVVAALIEQNGVDNAAFKPVTDKLPEIITAGSSTPVEAFDLAGMFPVVHDMVTYSGSLTTPPCSQVVAWNIFTHPVTLSEQQLEAFRSLKGPLGNAIVNNFRPIQKLNGRHLDWNVSARGL